MLQFSSVEKSKMVAKMVDMLWNGWIKTWMLLWKLFSKPKPAYIYFVATGLML